MNALQTTSLFAYQQIKQTLGERQRAVLDELAKHTDMTNGELAAALGWSINRVTPRTNELVKQGRVAEACRRADKVTGRTCIAWRIKS